MVIRYFVVLFFLLSFSLNGMEVQGRKDTKVSTMLPDLIRDRAFIQTCMYGVFSSTKQHFVSFAPQDSHQNFMEYEEDIADLYKSICQDALKTQLLIFIRFHRYLCNNDLAELKIAIQQSNHDSSFFAKNVAKEHKDEIRRELQSIFDVFYVYRQSHEYEQAKNLIKTIKRNRVELHTQLEAGDCENIVEASKKVRQLDVLIKEKEEEERKENERMREIIEKVPRNTSFMTTCMYGEFAKDARPFFLMFPAGSGSEGYTEYIGDIPALYKCICKYAEEHRDQYVLEEFRRYLAHEDMAELVFALLKKYKSDQEGYFFGRNINEDHATIIRGNLQKMLDSFYEHRKWCENQNKKAKPIVELMETIEENRDNLHTSLQEGDLERIIEMSKKPRQLDVLVKSMEEEKSEEDEQEDKVIETGTDTSTVVGESQDQDKSTSTPWKVGNSNNWKEQFMNLGERSLSSPNLLKDNKSKSIKLWSSLGSSGSESPKKSKTPPLKFAQLLRSYSANSSPQGSPRQQGSPRGQRFSPSSSPRKWFKFRSSSQGELADVQSTTTATATTNTTSTTTTTTTTTVKTVDKGDNS